MRSRLIVLGSTMMLSLILGGAQRVEAGAVTIVNPSFEVDPTGFYTYLTPTGWSFLSGNGGVFRPANVNNGGNGDYMDPAQFPNEAPDGIQVVYVTNGTLSQVTSTAAVLGQQYTLDVWTGTQNNLGVPSTPFSVGLYDGGTAIASFSGPSPVNVYQEIVVSGTGLGLGNLEVRLTSGSQTLFDDVKINAADSVASPEPTTLAGAGFAIVAGLLGLKTRKRMSAD